MMRQREGWGLQRLRDLREDRDLRQIDVSRETGIDQKTLSNYETGKTNPDSEALWKLADFFGVTLDELVGRKPPVPTRRELAARLEQIQRELADIQRWL